MTAPSQPIEDVRMRGFRHRSTVNEAQAWVDRHAVRLAAEPVPVAQCAGRVLAAGVTASRDLPPFDRAAMDGYALRGAETTGADFYNPLPFRLVGSSMPGRPCQEVVNQGCAARIMTGAPLPAGADAVLPAEYAQERGPVVEALAAVPPAKNVGRQGEDVRAGTVVLAAGRRLRPQDLGLAAACGAPSLHVVRRPRVLLIVTGDELLPCGAPCPPHHLFDANTPMLLALARRDGASIAAHALVRDDADAIAAQLQMPGVDLILVSGGSSVGAEDHAPAVVARLGELAIHGVAMRPSSPTGMGLISGAMVFLLPGNPVSCLCAYDFFAGRAARQMGGLPADWPYPRRAATVGRKIVSAVGRVDYVRVRFVDGMIEPIAAGGAGILSSATSADGFVVIPAESEGLPPGATATVFMYEPVP
jgi:molybdopterin molybdotransferase